MQDFINQAEKNGIVLSNIGQCQFCGANYQKGIYDCMEHYNKGLEILDFNDIENHIYKFLSVDAHALQHPEIHGRWSNHFHLSRLNLILDKKIKWDYTKSPLLSNYLNDYKINRSDEYLSVPEPFKRGTITNKDLDEVVDIEECRSLIKQWAESVYFAWENNHALVSKIADGFIITRGL